MPQMSGIEATEKIVEIFKNAKNKVVPIIGLTGDADSEIVKECKKAGMIDVLEKPCSKAQVMQVVKKHRISLTCSCSTKLLSYH